MYMYLWYWYSRISDMLVLFGKCIDEWKFCVIFDYVLTLPVMAICMSLLYSPITSF